MDKKIFLRKQYITFLEPRSILYMLLYMKQTCSKQTIIKKNTYFLVYNYMTKSPVLLQHFFTKAEGKIFTGSM